VIYAAVYLYVIGATMMWWYARSTSKPMAGKIMAVFGWPIIVPIAALWA
jgi:hypothetical protein